MTDTEVTTPSLMMRETGAVAEAPPSVMHLLQQALTGQGSVEAVEKLVELYERIQKRQAEIDFSAALAAFQQDVPTVAPNREVRGKGFGFRYATFDHIVKTIRPTLSRHGLSFTFNTADISENGRITIDCFVRHNGGHTDRTRFAAPIDRGASMNETQKVASASTYARRNALILALGLTTGEVDDDGTAAGTKHISGEQADTITKLIADVGADAGKLCQYLGIDNIGEIPLARYAEVMQMLERKRAQKAASDAE